MSFVVEWFGTEQRAVVRRLSPGWAWDDFEVAFDQMFAMMREVEHPVDILLDDRHAPDPPPGTEAMLRFGKIWSRHPDNLRRIIIVGADDYLRSMGEAFAGAFTGDADTVHYVDTMKEAKALISGSE